jgi:hypothetical protein
LIGGTPQDKENSNFQVFQRTAKEIPALHGVKCGRLPRKLDS